jgi:hypothetical protein
MNDFAFMAQVVSARRPEPKPPEELMHADGAAATTLPFRYVTPKAADRFITCVPLTSLRAAAGRFSDEQAGFDEVAGWASEWVTWDGHPAFQPGMFVARVMVLQYELRTAGGGGKAFVRGVKDYVKTYSSAKRPVPPEHVLVFDEAQRAFDAEMVRLKHKDGSGADKSEPEHFIEFAERIPEWCVVVGLIGGGQEIHVGEEAGLVQWRWAVERASRPGDWHVHAPLAVADVFDGARPNSASSPL